MLRNGGKFCKYNAPGAPDATLCSILRRARIMDDSEIAILDMRHHSMHVYMSNSHINILDLRKISSTRRHKV